MTTWEVEQNCATSIPACYERPMRSPDVRLRTAAAAAMVLLAVGLSAAGASARPRDTAPRNSGTNGIVVVQVNGLVDPSNASLISHSLRDAAADRASLVVFQLDGSGAVDVNTDALVGQVFNSRVPVVAWVGPSGAEAKGATGLIALATSNVSVAAGAHIGPIVPVNYDDPGAVSVKQATAQVAVLERRNRPDAKNPASVVTDRLSGKTAVADGLIDDTQPTLFQFIVELDGHVLHTANGDVKVSTKATSGVGANRQVGVNQVVSFRKLDLVQQLAHTLNTPWVAYFLFLAGLSLMLFEFFTAGVGIAGVVGAVAFVGACFGFSHLPIAPWAVGLLVFGIFGLAVDLQAGGLGPWTFIGGGGVFGGVFLVLGGGGG